MWSVELSHRSKLTVTSQTRSQAANCHTEINSKGTKGASVLVLFLFDVQWKSANLCADKKFGCGDRDSNFN